MNYSLSFIVATKNRPQELMRLLRSILAQSVVVQQVIIVDASDDPVEGILNEFYKLNIVYVRSDFSSAARQRNLGLKVLDKDIDFVGFFDDDVELENDALFAMMNFWRNSPFDIAGAAFNMINCPSPIALSFKTSSLSGKLGLYTKEKGKVLPSGFHTIIGYTKHNISVQWLPTCAVVWRREILEDYHFDEWFNGYSYLEDLDFSYNISRKYKLEVVAGAKYRHFVASKGRVKSYEFGKKEVVNRIYFVKKYNELSVAKCCLVLTFRILFSLFLSIKEAKVSYLQRIGGNIVGLISMIFRKEHIGR